MRKSAIITAVASLTVGYSVALSAPIEPIQLAASSYDQNIVIGSGTGVYTAVTAGMDGAVYALPGSNYTNSGPFSGDTFYTQGYNAGATMTGVPLGTSIVSEANPNTTFAFQSATATYNAAVLTEQTAASSTDTLTLSAPAAYSTLAFLGVNNSASINLTVNFQGGGTQTGTLNFPGWFNPGPTVAYSAEGRAAITGTTNPDGSVDTTGFGNIDNGQTGNSNGDLLFEQDVTVTDTTDPITSISLSIVGGGSTYESDAIFAVSGQIVPEPATLSLIGIGAAGMLMKRRRQMA